MKRLPQLYPGGWGLGLPSPALLPWGQLLSIKTWQLLLLWLWSSCLSFWSLGQHCSVAVWETSHSCSWVRKAQSLEKKKKVTSFCWQIFEDALKTSTLLSRLRRRFLGASPLLPSAATVASISGRKKCPLNRQDGICCNSHILRQCHGLLCLDREGKKRRGNLQDR